MERLGPDDQGGFNWTVTFTSDTQDGDLPLLTVETDALTGTDTLIEVYSVEDGSYLDGSVNATFDGNSTLVAANATAEDMRVALEAIGTGSVSVFREGMPMHSSGVWRLTELMKATESCLTDRGSSTPPCVSLLLYVSVDVL